MQDRVIDRKGVADKTGMQKTRRLRFTGLKNLRDMGGYQTVDGKTVRWGLLYRSGSLEKLTERDLKRLSALGLDRVIDLRSAHETERHPDRLPGSMNIRLVLIPILDSTTEAWFRSGRELIKNMKEGGASEYMCTTNQELATRFTPEMRLFLRELMCAEGRPVLFHCAAGKDRTGFAAAILLRTLGVPQDIVMNDYLLTNKYFLSSNQLNLALLRLMKGKRPMLLVRGFIEANPAYLNAGFEAIDCEYGSFETYVHDGLGLSEADIEHLKNLYLE